MSESLITPGVTYQFGNAMKGDCINVDVICKSRGSGASAGGFNLEGLIAQNVTAQIQKQPRQYYEIGSTKYYVVESRPSGSGSIDHIVGPNTVNVWGAIKALADVCNETDLKVWKKSGCSCPNASFVGSITFVDGLLNTFQVTATANEWVLTSRLGFTFYDLVQP